MPRRSPSLRCPFCRGLLREIRADVEKTSSSKDVVVTSVPAWECQKCHEIFLAYKYLRLIDKTVLFLLEQAGVLAKNSPYYQVFTFDEIERLAIERGTVS